MTHHKCFGLWAFINLTVILLSKIRIFHIVDSDFTVKILLAYFLFPTQHFIVYKPEK
jgi:hypothetical protein